MDLETHRFRATVNNRDGDKIGEEDVILFGGETIFNYAKSIKAYDAEGNYLQDIIINNNRCINVDESWFRENCELERFDDGCYILRCSWLGWQCREVYIDLKKYICVYSWRNLEWRYTSVAVTIMETLRRMFGFDYHRYTNSEICHIGSFNQKSGYYRHIEKLVLDNGFMEVVTYNGVGDAYLKPISPKKILTEELIPDFNCYEDTIKYTKVLFDGIKDKDEFRKTNKLIKTLNRMANVKNRV